MNIDKHVQKEGEEYNELLLTHHPALTAINPWLILLYYTPSIPFSDYFRDNI